ncbi:type I restriction endonuclease subunit R, EcoR124 family [Maribacter flavus]|nr:abortive infection family protein [Maribacter flavus]
MEKTRAMISANAEKHSHFEEYFKIIEIIEEHTLINPDVCIESCKALVEGISKTILINLDNTKTTENIDKDDLPKLFKDAMRILSDECEDLDGDFAARFSAIIQVIGEIRNKRSDISHGRMAPKFIFSSSKLASTVVNMTDSMLEYILEHYFSLNHTSDSALDYASKKMKAYNDWLDESVEFPIKKARFSKLLFENDYDEYENRFRNEFSQDIEEELKEAVSSIVDSLFISATKRESKIKKKIPVETKKEAAVITAEKEKTAEQEEKIIEKLVSDFDEDTFWSEAKNRALQEFAEAENLKSEELIEVVNEYLFSEKPPLRDDVAKTMNERPKLSEFKTVVPNLTEKIVAFANDLKNPEAEA